ncbi:MAG: DNA recombination protein RmuC [Parvularculaceae bacterium]
MENLAQLLIIPIVGAILAGMLFVIHRVQRARKTFVRQAADEKSHALERKIEDLVAAHTALSGRVEQLTTSAQSSQAHLARTVEKRLEEITGAVTARLGEQAGQTDEALTQLNERIAAIASAQESLSKLSEDVIDLHSVLADRRARGAFGEIQLHDLIVSALPKEAYEMPATLSSGRRADCLIRLPYPPGPIAIDARFPLDAYQQLTAARGDEEKAAAAAAFRKAVLKHVVELNEKLIVSGETADSTLMFTPSEAAYAELHANFPDVVQASFQARVWIVSPTTLMATLNTIRAIMKDAEIREQTKALQAEAAKLIVDIDHLKIRTENLSRNFAQAQTDISEIASAAGRVGKRAHLIENMRLGGARRNGGEKAVPAPARTPTAAAAQPAKRPAQQPTAAK